MVLPLRNPHPRYLPGFLSSSSSLTGFLVDFIPIPVISGFTSAAAITIAFGQLKVTTHFLLVSSPLNFTLPPPMQSLLGIQHIRRPFVEEVGDIFQHIKETK